MGVLQPTWKTVQGKVNLKIFNNEMRTPIVIGKNEFKYQKDAIKFYKKILNSYDFGDSLNENDFDHIIELVKYNNSFFSEDMEVEIQESTDSNTKEDVYIYDVVIAEVQFKTKCFEIIYSNSENWLISFRLMINQHQENTRTTFTRACRGAVQNDIRSVKQSYFDKFSVKGHVDCQESGIKSSWQELTVYHRQPNTFSVIVDRFIEVNALDITKIEYDFDVNTIMMIEESVLSEKFREYHKQKAALRIVRKEYNSSRSNMAKISHQKKDLRIE